MTSRQPSRPESGGDDNVRGGGWLSAHAARAEQARGGDPGALRRGSGEKRVLVGGREGGICEVYCAIG